MATCARSGASPLLLRLCVAECVAFVGSELRSIGGAFAGPLVRLCRSHPVCRRRMHLAAAPSVASAPTHTISSPITLPVCLAQRARRVDGAGAQRASHLRALTLGGAASRGAGVRLLSDITRIDQVQPEIVRDVGV